MDSVNSRKREVTDASVRFFRGNGEWGLTYPLGDGPQMIVPR